MRAFFAVAEEQVAAAGGAETANEDVPGGEAGVEELGAIGLAQIEENVFWRRLMAGRGHIEPLERIRLVASTKFVEPLGSIWKL